MISYFYRSVRDDVVKELETFRTGIWVHVQQPKDEELSQLAEELQLDRAILADAQDFFEVPRMERSDDTLYFFTRYPYAEKEEDPDTAPLLLVVADSFVMTISQREVPQFNQFIFGETVVHTTQKTKLFLQLMGSVATSFERELTRLRRGVQRDRARLRKISNRDIVRLVNYEHRLNDMVSATVPTNAWLQKVAKGNQLALYESDRELMDDLTIANAQLIESSQSLLKTIQNIRTASEAILTNTLNYTIRTLTILTVLLTLPMIITAFFGMNVPLPFSQDPLASIYIIVLTASIVTACVWLFKRYDWF